MKFYLGTHLPGWLGTVDVPLFVSHRRLARYKTLPVARTGWALDSGGFSELSLFGQWRTSPQQYLAAVRRHVSDVGRLEWAAPQDWMCEPVLLAKTGLSAAEHQRRTVENYLTLRHSDADLPFVPVVQGWQPDDYLRHVDDYTTAGVDLTAAPRVGLGSVCRRQNTGQISYLAGRLAELGIRLHGFGVKTAGLSRYARHLISADSMAWSYGGRRNPDPDCPKRTCANCAHHGLAWRTRIVADLRYQQLTLEDAA